MKKTPAQQCPIYTRWRGCRAATPPHPSSVVMIKTPGIAGNNIIDRAIRVTAPLSRDRRNETIPPNSDPVVLLAAWKRTSGLVGRVGEAALLAVMFVNDRVANIMERKRRDVKILFYAY